MDFEEFAQRFREHAEQRLAAFEQELDRARKQSAQAKERQRRLGQLDAIAAQRRFRERGPVRSILR